MAQLLAALLLVTAGALPTPAQEPAAEVSVRDGGLQSHPATHECTPGHRVETHEITLDSGAKRYAFRYTGCVDPSHGELRPSAEGNFGMPQPSSGNWYWGGFLQVFINGSNATGYRLADMRVTETGARGAFQAIWAHPDAEVGVRLMMLPGANHVLALVTWRPRPDAQIESVAVQLRCYPSFFTAARGRKGERHCQTPRTDQAEPETLELVPAEDSYLFYYDAVFDVARGEGDGPCAALVAPDGVEGGRVQIGDYAVITRIALEPQAPEARLAFYDFTGMTNAEAQAYLAAQGAEDLARLTETDFRPEPVRRFRLDQFRAEAEKLLADAGEDGEAFQPKVQELLDGATALKEQAEQGDWQAEADLAALLDSSTEMLWKLRAFAALNAP